MTDTRRHRVVVIAGPTASGKTSLGVKLALALGGEILNADSMQVYRGMDVGTAKPTREEQKGIPHHLLDVVDPDEEFNAAIYRSMAIPVITDMVARDKPCFVAGGTGLYIRSLLKGLFECPPSDMEIRESLRRECDTLGSPGLHERLVDIDPQCAQKIHPNDSIRIIRALEIIRLTGRRPSEVTGEHGFRDSRFNALELCLDVDREELYDRINRRSVRMFEKGLARETENLLRKGYSPELKPMKSIGYRHMIMCLKGDWSREDAIRRLQRDTRRYAKRQLTWFRADPEFLWIRPDDFEPVLERVRTFLFESA